MLKVVKVEPGQYAYVTEIDKGLDSLQAAVGGLIDCAYPWNDEMVCIVCNDEGLLNGMPLNRNVENYQVIAGPFFVCGIKGEDFCSLTDEQAERYKAMFFQPELFVPCSDEIMWLKYDNPNLPGAPDTVKQEYERRHNLPMYSFNPAHGRNAVILMRYGESGYWPVDHIPDGVGAQEYADQLNQTLGVSKAQQTAMLYGSMFSWDIPAAHPDRYDENGQPKPRGQKRGDKER